MSGAVYRVSPFTRMDLFDSVPTTMTELAPDGGAVLAGATIEWTLPTSSVTPNGSLFVGVITTSTNGVDYDNLNGTVAPKLVVTAE
jgi:hypothetical protein